MKTIGIIGALPEEVEQLVASLENPRSEEYAGVIYHQAKLDGKNIIICCGGMGKANAASTTQVLITKFGVNSIIFSGIAGNTNSQIGIGDVVIGKTLVYHDAEDSMLSQSAPGTAQYTADPTLLATVEAACKEVGAKYIVGKIATGDTFVGNPTQKNDIQQRVNPDCVEMEGAAIAQISMRNGIPFVVIRAMSDNSDVEIDFLREKEFDVTEYVSTASKIVLSTILNL